ncbi:hypothetical protein RN001_001563 [Aquatica leii]|uniref:THAP-type domain-containing protein n=1 Tax=Aquatica leii TaxID=1421715 RepID=A0AAN7Q7X9_9COLE|nr:hypothetical protein RN001_001563 [Aquatica leii]
MPAFCCVVGCGSRGERDNVKFYAFPKILNFPHTQHINALSQVRRQKWINAIKREDLTEAKLKYATVCSKHFINGKPAGREDSNNPDWVPSINLDEIEWNPYDKSCQTSLDSANISHLMLASTRCDKLQKKLNSISLSYESFKSNDFKMRYYTDLDSFSKLEILIKYIEPYVEIHFNTSLNAVQQIILTLVKLRLNLDFKDLAFRFNISPTTASVYFENIINVMYNRLRKLIIWPDKDILQKTMPSCFVETFKDKTTVVIDCFEVFIEKPFSLLMAAQCWSNYKHNYTLKFLIGITPQGTVYRGFLINEYVQTLQAQVITPAFTKGKNQLHPTDIEATRSLAHVRIHVERIIGTIRQKYRILSDTVPITLVSRGQTDPILDKIVRCCCALVNLCTPIIPS